MSAAFLALTGAQSNGCDPGDPGIVCQDPGVVECPDGTLEPGGVDENGCVLPDVCVPNQEDPCIAAGGSIVQTCTLDDQCPDRDCGCEEYCDCGPEAYFDGQACVPIGPPDPNDICELSGGYPYEWCYDDCGGYFDEDGDGIPDDGQEPQPDCEGVEPTCYTDCDCGFDAYFDPYFGCVPIDPGTLCEATGGHFCEGYCECPYGLIYDEFSGCIPDPVMLCEGSGGVPTVTCLDPEQGFEDEFGQEPYCYQDCDCGEGYVFDWSYGCYPGPQLLCEWSGGAFGEVCSEDWGEPVCWDDCTCPEGTYFDYYSGCVIDYATVCAQAGGEWTVTCDEQWGSCWEDCVCPEGLYFDYVSACVAPEDCTNGLDDDGNGLVDCDDWMCQGTEGCPIVY